MRVLGQNRIALELGKTLHAYVGRVSLLQTAVHQQAQSGLLDVPSVTLT